MQRNRGERGGTRGIVVDSRHAVRVAEPQSSRAGERRGARTSYVWKPRKGSSNTATFQAVVAGPLVHTVSQATRMQSLVEETQVRAGNKRPAPPDKVVLCSFGVVGTYVCTSSSSSPAGGSSSGSSSRGSEGSPLSLPTTAPASASYSGLRAGICRRDVSVLTQK